MPVYGIQKQQEREYFMMNIEEKEEKYLQQILQLCLGMTKHILNTKKQYAQLQSLLTDYSSDEELISIIYKVLKFLHRVFLKTQNKNLEDSYQGYIQESEYLKLEQALQKYEAQARVHAKSSQQRLLYCEELQAKIKDSETSKHQLVSSTKKTILELKKQNQQLIGKIKSLQETLISEKRRSCEASLKQSFQRKQIVQTPDSKDHKETGSNKRVKVHLNKSPISSERFLKPPYKQNPKRQSNIRIRCDSSSKAMETIEISHSRKGSHSNLKIRDKKFL